MKGQTSALTRKQKIAGVTDTRDTSFYMTILENKIPSII